MSLVRLLNDTFDRILEVFGAIVASDDNRDFHEFYPEMYIACGANRTILMNTKNVYAIHTNV